MAVRSVFGGEVGGTGNYQVFVVDLNDGGTGATECLPDRILPQFRKWKSEIEAYDADDEDNTFMAFHD